MIIIWILFPCLLSGVLFAALAVWLTTRKGNTISEVLQSAKLADAPALKLEILDKVKLVSTYPIVALYVVAFAVAIALPAFIAWELLKDVSTITLSGKVANKAPDKNVYVTPKGMGVERSGSFDIPLPYHEGSQIINFEGKDYFPLTLRVTLSKLKGSLKVEITGLSPVEIPLDLEGKGANLAAAIPLSPATDVVSQGVSNSPTTQPPVSGQHEDVPPPPDRR